MSAHTIRERMEPPWREGDLRKRFARVAVEEAMERHRMGKGAGRIWMQGVVVEVQTPCRWTLDDGSMTVDVDAQALQAKQGRAKHLAVGNYVRLIGKGIVRRTAKQPESDASSKALEVIFKALQVSTLHAPDRDALWMLEVVLAHRQVGGTQT